jgi:hypothetical protein
VVGVVAMCWLVRREGKRSEEKRRAPECLVNGLGRSSAPGLRHGAIEPAYPSVGRFDT